MLGLHLLGARNFQLPANIRKLLLFLREFQLRLLVLLRRCLHDLHPISMDDPRCRACKPRSL